MTIVESNVELFTITQGPVESLDDDYEELKPEDKEIL